MGKIEANNIGNDKWLKIASWLQLSSFAIADGDRVPPAQQVAEAA